MQPALRNRISWRCTGFSLLELVIVLAIIAVFAAIAFPRYANSLSRYRVDVAARQVAVDLEMARSQAMSRSRSFSIAFDLVGEEYTIVGVRGLNGGANYRVDMSAEPFQVDIYSASFGGVPTATFDMFGKPAAGGTIVVSIGAVKRTIMLNAATGRATIS